MSPKSRVNDLGICSKYRSLRWSVRMAPRARNFFAVLTKTVNVKRVETLMAEEGRCECRALARPQWM